MIKIERKDGIKRLVISNPARKNAIGVSDVKILSKELEKAWEEKDVDVIVITGEGDAFCSGLDLAGSREDISRKDIIDLFEWHVEEFTGVIKNSIECPKVVIGRINGPAAGFGCEMLYWFDYKIAHKNAYFYELFPKRGLIPDGGGIPFLGKTLGFTKAFPLLSEAQRISAQKALEIGIINEIAEDELDLDSKINNKVNEIRKLPQGVVSKIKKLMWSDIFENLENHIRHLRVLQAHQVLSEEFLEGITSFFQKKEPEFKKVF
ncbi:MAG: enoyl-CoA hydratase/isomerase family protein [Candidatus Calescibacterium sp.]|nr:enoyl-CoA hydratase/isomerase family protein [Candidatus Calescibacterium sp.]MCX7734517.1 enoyl-CoA hydratase/isomerase family protein [bacterium]MDW8087658.1 enoyl-CoA hydratase/isomerase family protein [Candidatus Calescibacterium sp.]